MFRYVFKEFEDTNEQNYQSSDQTECCLNDSMFRCFIHWYTKPNQSIQDEKRTFQNIAKQFNAILCIWRIATQNDEQYNMIDVKAIEDIHKLPQLLSQALEVSKTTLMKTKFRVLSICIINKFGSFQAQKCYSICDKCGQQERLNECCAQFMCNKCNKNNGQSCCLYCHKKLQVSSIPLQTVCVCQSKHIYQPMFPYLSLQQRFELMDMIEQDNQYN